MNQLPDVSLLGVANTGDDLITLTMKEKPDVAIVNTSLPNINGMDAYKACKELYPELEVIFITGHDGHAAEAFRLNATDYIVKPVERDRLYSALNRVNIPQENTEDRYQQKVLTIKDQNNIRFIPFEDILFIEKIDRKTFIHTKSFMFETNEPLSEYERLLDDRFMLAHRSNIINLEEISRIEVNRQMYIAHFFGYEPNAKISKHKMSDIQDFKKITKVINAKAKKIDPKSTD